MIQCGKVFFHGNDYTVFFDPTTGKRTFFQFSKKERWTLVDPQIESQLKDRYSTMILANHFRDDWDEFDDWNERNRQRQKRIQKRARRKFCLIAGLVIALAGTSIWGLGKYFSLKKEAPYETMIDTSEEKESSLEEIPSSEEETDDLDQFAKEFLEQEQARIEKVPFQYESQIQPLQNQQEESYYELAEKHLFNNQQVGLLEEHSLENLKEMIVTYGEYMDWEEVGRRLQMVDVVCGEENFVKQLPSVAAYYSGFDIYIPDGNENLFLIRPDAKQIFDHEFIHLLSCYGFVRQNFHTDEYNDFSSSVDNPDFDYALLGSCLTEGMTQQLTVEFSGDTLSRYSLQRNYTNAMTEILGTEVMLRAYWGHDLNILIEELEKYVGMEKTYQLLVDLDLVHSNSNLLSSLLLSENNGEKLSVEELQTREDLERTNATLNQQIWEVMGEIYLEKTGLSIEDDLLMSAYHSATTGASLDSIYYFPDHETTVEVEVTYFSPSRMEELRAPQIQYRYGQMVELEEKSVQYNGIPVKIVTQVNYASEYVTEGNRYSVAPTKPAVKVK